MAKIRGPAVGCDPLCVASWYRSPCHDRYGSTGTADACTTYAQSSNELGYPLLEVPPTAPQSRARHYRATAARGAVTEVQNAPPHPLLALKPANSP
jgi:hypothetical protein